MTVPHATPTRPPRRLPQPPIRMATRRHVHRLTWLIDEINRERASLYYGIVIGVCVTFLIVTVF